jgi:multiple sugar transport system substrate-binding protein
MRRPSRRVERAVAVAAVWSLAATACLGGGTEDGDDAASPGAAVSPIVPTEPTEPVTITFSSWVGDSPQMQRFAEEFQELHPNITVEFQAVSAGQSTTKLTTQVAGGTAPDVAFVDASAVEEFASRDALVNLDGYMAGSETTKAEHFVPAFLQMSQFEGSVYGVPYDGETTGLFYRTDLFEKAGIAEPPATWEEFEAAAQALTDPAAKQYGFIIFAPEAEYYWEPFLWQAGGHLTTEDGRDIAFDSPEGRLAAEFYVGLREYSPPDYFGSNSWDGRVAFATGKVAMYEAGAWFGGEMKSSFPQIDGKWDVAPLPSGPAGCATTVAGDSLVMFDESATGQEENQDAAWLWIEYLTQPENMKAWTYGEPTTTLLPPRTELLSDPDLGKHNPWLQGFADQMDCAVTDNLSHRNWGEVADALNAELGKAIFGDITADQAITNAAEKGRELMSGG